MRRDQFRHAGFPARLPLHRLQYLSSNHTERPDHFTGNLALNGVPGAKMIWAGALDDEALDALAEQKVRRLQEQGLPAALIPLKINSINSFIFSHC
jgi:hypothetical protein